MSEMEIGTTVQMPRQTGNPASDASMVTGAGNLSRLLQLNISTSMEKAPAYWSRNRDNWLVDFVHAEGNDLLAGAVSTVTAKVVANNWYVEGPLVMASVAREQLLHWSAFGGGWSQMISPTIEGFLTRDAGGIMELHRASRADIVGPAMGYSHLDESKCEPTHDPEMPYYYYRDDGRRVTMNRSWVAPIIDMPSGKDSLRGVGYCSTSRAITTSLTLQQVSKYKRERLSDLPPAALLLINNLSEEEWGDLAANYDAQTYNMGNTTWRRVMVAFGIDPAYPLQAEMIPFSELPEHFNEKEFIEITVYSFALAFREDAREFWPVSSGPLGTATESELQARSARLKGEGIICVAIERQLNRSEALPSEVEFHFDFQDDERDMLSAELKDLKSQTIRRFWEASPNSGTTGLYDEQAADSGGGIITTDEARMWALRERIIPYDVLAQEVDVDRIYDTKTWSVEDLGPLVRYYRDGRCLVAQRFRRWW